MIAGVLAACAPTFPPGSILTVTPAGSGGRVSWPAAGGTIATYRVDVDGIEITRLASPARACALSGLTAGSHVVTVTAYNPGGEWSGSAETNGKVTGTITAPTPATPGTPITCTSVATLVRITEGNQIALPLAPKVSGDGRWIAFSSAGPVLPSDTDYLPDTFLRDRSTGTTVMVSDSTLASLVLSITTDGRYVAWETLDSGLGETKRYEWDRTTGTSRPLDTTLDGRPARFLSMTDDSQTLLYSIDPFSDVPGGYALVDRASGAVTHFSYGLGTGPDPYGLTTPLMSGDGSYFVFFAEHLAGDRRQALYGFPRTAGPVTLTDLGPANFESDGSISDDGRSIAFTLGDDVYLVDRVTGVRTRITTGNGSSQDERVSGDGRHVAFSSAATNLSPDAFTYTNVYVWDQATGRSTPLANSLEVGTPILPDLSDDGGVVAFVSDQGDLVPGDDPIGPDFFLWTRVP